MFSRLVETFRGFVKVKTTVPPNEISKKEMEEIHRRASQAAASGISEITYHRLSNEKTEIIKL